MWQLVGIRTKTVYGEKKHKSDLVKWYTDTYCFQGEKGAIEYRLPETMRFVHTGQQRTRIQKELDLLDDGKYEEYRQIKNMERQNSEEQKLYEKYKTDDEFIIARRKKVVELNAKGMSVNTIANEVGARRETVVNDLFAVGKLTESHGERWGPADDAYLIANKDRISVRKIAIHLERTNRAVYSRWNYLKTRKLKNKKE